MYRKINSKTTYYDTTNSPPYRRYNGPAKS